MSIYRLPGELLVAPGNLMSVSTTPKHAASILRAYLDLGVDVLLLTECADVDVQRVADQHAPDEWRVCQYGATGSAPSALAIVVRKSAAILVGDWIRVATEATSEGGGIRDRHIVGGRLHARSRHRWSPRVAVGHAPPPRAPRTRGRFIAQFAAVRGIRGGDTNTPLRVVARMVGGQVFANGVLTLIVPRRLKARHVQTVRRQKLANADHGTVIVGVRPRKMRAR